MPDVQVSRWETGTCWVVLKGRQTLKTGRPGLDFYDSWKGLMGCRQPSLSAGGRVKKPWPWDRTRQPVAQQGRSEIRQGGTYLIEEARSLLGAKRGLEQHPNHHGEMRGGRSRTQEERLESPWSWALACIYTPRPCNKYRNQHMLLKAVWRG